MKFQSALLSSASGSISGATFTSFRNVNVIRKKVGPRDHTSQFTQLRKQQQKLIVAYWQSITESQRTAWNEMAKTVPRTNKFGEVYTSSGFNLFRERQLNAMIIGTSGIVTPKPLKEVPTNRWYISTNDPGDRTLGKVIGQPAVTSNIVFYAGNQNNGSSLNPLYATYRIAQVRPGNAAGINVLSVYALAKWQMSYAKPAYIKLLFIDPTTFQRSIAQYFVLPPV